jgi:hypothetical protein
MHSLQVAEDDSVASPAHLNNAIVDHINLKHGIAGRPDKLDNAFGESGGILIFIAHRRHEHFRANADA